MDSELMTLASMQRGVFTTAQAREAGVGARGLAALRARGLVRPVARSVHVLTEAWPRWASDQFVVRSRAAAVLYPDARLCAASLLAVGGVPLHGAPLRRADLAREGEHEVLTALARLRPPHPVLRPLLEDTDEVDGPSLAAAVVQTAMDVGGACGTVAADHLLHEGSVTRSQIEQVALATRGWPRAGRVAFLLRTMDGRSQSVGETRLRLFTRVLGIAAVPQLPIEDDDGVFAYADLWVEGTNLLLEFDGRVKYGSTPDELWHEKQREDRIRRRGYGFERVVWDELQAPRVLGARIRRAVARAGPPPPGILLSA